MPDNRYYISCRINGAKRTDTTAWRIPAPELDSTVALFIIKLLGDRSRLVEWIGVYRPGADIKRCLDAAANFQTRFANDRAADQRVVLLAVVRKISLAAEAIAFTIDASALVAMLRDGTSTVHMSEPDDHDQTDAHVTLDLPVTIKRRGNEMRLVIHSDDLARIPDQSLVTMIARAHAYFKYLTRAPGISVTDVAEHFGVHRVDVGRILPLAFLAPKLVDQILTGNQPSDLSARRLARDNLPLLWADQLAALS